MENRNKAKWYQSTVGIIALLILFFPAGLFLMWKYAVWNKKVKWGVTNGFILLFVISAIVGNLTPSTNTVSNKQDVVAQQGTATPPQPTITPKPTAVPMAIDGMGISFDQITNGLGLNMQPVDGQKDTYLGLFDNKVGSSLRVIGNKQNISKAWININRIQDAQNNAQVQLELNTALPEFVSNAFPNDPSAKQWVSKVIETISNNDSEDYQEQSTVIDNKKITVKVNKTIGFIQVDIEKVN